MKDQREKNPRKTNGENNTQQAITLKEINTKIEKREKVGGKKE